MSIAVSAQKPMHETHRIAVDGAVDADGHILEPPDLWENYIDPQFRDRALRFRIDEGGLEELEIEGASRRPWAPWAFPTLANSSVTPNVPTCARHRTERCTQASASTCSMPKTPTSRSCTPRSGCCGRPRYRTRRWPRPTPRRTTAGSPSSATTHRVWFPPHIFPWVIL